MLSNKPVRALILSAVVGLGVLAAPRAAAQTYAITELDDSGAAFSRAYAINETGQIIGIARVGNQTHSVHWLNNVFTDLHGTPHLELLLEFNVGISEAYNISNGDQIVGTARKQIKCGEETIIVTTAMLLRPAVLSDLGTPIPGDALTDLGTFGDPCVAKVSAAVGISNANHVVGWADLGIDGIRAFLITPENGRWFVQDPNTPYVNRLMVDLGTLDSASVESSASAVNDAGIVVGWAYNQARYHAFMVVPDNGVWFQNASGDGVTNDLMSSLGTLGGFNSWARDINNSNQIVGESDTANGTTRAFLWENGVMTDLGTLGGNNSSASRISDQGLIVGWAENEAGQRRACMWIDGQIIDLNDQLLATANPRSVLTEARDINARGEIVGWGTIRSGTQTVDKAFFLRLATADEIAEAEAFLEEQQGGTGGAPTGGGPTGPGGTGTFMGIPLTVTPVADDTAEPDNGDGDGVIAPAPCGFGAVGMMPAIMLSLCAWRAGSRLRRAQPRS